MATFLYEFRYSVLCESLQTCQHGSDTEHHKPLEPGDDGAVADDELLKVVRCEAVKDDENAKRGLEREVVKHTIAQLQIMLKRVRRVAGSQMTETFKNFGGSMLM